MERINANALSALLNQLTIKPQLQASSLDQPEKKKQINQQSIPSLPTCTSLGIKVKTRLDALNFSTLDASVLIRLEIQF